MSKIPNSLALIALKCAPGVFDLSSGLTEFSIRDQIVRAALFAQQMTSTGLVTPTSEVLIIGAGIAGLVAGVRLASRKIPVTILERNAQPFSAQRFSHQRYVGPFMYEWPFLFHGSQSFPSDSDSIRFSVNNASLPVWHSPDAMIAGDLVRQFLDPWLVQQLQTHGTHLNVFTGLHPDEVTSLVTGFRSGIRTNPPQLAGYRLATLGAAGTGFQLGTKEAVEPAFDFIVLAAGAGAETSVPGSPFTPVWRDDFLDEPATADLNIGVLGGGDGALQDFLRATLNCAHPLDALDYIGTPTLRQAIRSSWLELASTETGNKRLSQWGFRTEGAELADRACVKAVTGLEADPATRTELLDWVGTIIRQGVGSVTLCRKNGAFWMLPPKSILGRHSRAPASRTPVEPNWDG